MNKDRYDFEDLIKIMQILRSPGGCPWDAEQTNHSLRRYLIEETYEVLDAMQNGGDEHFYDELGDLLLQIVFHAQIAQDEGRFDISDVTTAICKKMISRHAHVFGDVVAETSDDVLVSWEQIKKKEKGLESHTEAMKDIPASLPALMRAFKVQHKAAKAGFDWDDIQDVYAKVEEELAEVKDAIAHAKHKSEVEDEIGDLLFAAVNLSRFVNTHPELALSGTTEKFIRRFDHVETSALKQGKRLEDMSLAEMDVLWEQAKTLENGDANEN
ncbi:MAG: nucleoside triphosphate pyrophosphohydrolase [Bacillota bacterium]